MPISVPGQTLGIVPVFNGRRSIAYNYDFANGSPTMATQPSEFLQAMGAGWTFTDDGDGESVGVLKFDVSLTGGAQAPALAPQLQLGVCETLVWETRFWFSGFVSGGSNRQAFSIGFGTDTDGCAPLTLLGFVASNNSVGQCGVSYGTDNVLHAYGANGAFDSGNFFGSTPIANVTGVWTTLGVTWSAASATVNYFLNGASFGSANTTRIPLTQDLRMWFFGWSGFSAPPPAQIFKFDYATVALTLNR